MSRPILTIASIVVALGVIALSLLWINAGHSMSGIKASLGAAQPYHEIVNPAGFVNSDPFTLQSLIGKKVILLDFLTYSCINCQRTFPYLEKWYEEYKGDGFVVVGIHTPEFSFEKNIDNVRKAMQGFGITFPLVLDNEYGTWNAYGNQFWPHKYLIDIHGNIVYDHIGEGGYDETEHAIRAALDERAQVLGTAPVDSMPLATAGIPEVTVEAQSPETYFGSMRNDLLANAPANAVGEISFTIPSALKPNALYLGGKWNIFPEYALSGNGASIKYRYNAKDVYFVASADTATTITILQDGKPIGRAAGADISANSTVIIKDDRLYTIIHNEVPGDHILEIKIDGKLKAYTFTFG